MTGIMEVEVQLVIGVLVGRARSHRPSRARDGELSLLFSVSIRAARAAGEAEHHGPNVVDLHRLLHVDLAHEHAVIDDDVDQPARSSARVASRIGPAADAEPGGERLLVQALAGLSSPLRIMRSSSCCTMRRQRLGATERDGGRGVRTCIAQVLNRPVSDCQLLGLLTVYTHAGQVRAPFKRGEPMPFQPASRALVALHRPRSDPRPRRADRRAPARRLGRQRHQDRDAGGAREQAMRRAARATARTSRTSTATSAA